MPTLLEYKCPCCDGAIRFDSATQKMKCPYCDTEFDVETLQSYDEALHEQPADSMQWESTAEEASGSTEGMRVYLCKTCGGEILTDDTTVASSCPYCGNPVIMTEGLSGVLLPELIIPFKLDREQAKSAYRSHLSGKRLLPKVFADENHIDEVKGIYVPFWLFDADAEASIRYRATRVAMWSDSRYHYTQTSHFLLTREGTLGFEKVPVDGSEKMPDDLMDSIEPYDYSEAIPFATGYLAGYLADKYDVNENDSIPRANSRIKCSTEEVFARTATGYATCVPQSSSVRVDHGKAHYALLPVWILNTTWNGQNYLFAMNGQTGKLVGDLPMDKAAFWKWWGLFAGIFAAVFTLIGFFV